MATAGFCRNAATLVPDIIVEALVSEICMRAITYRKVDVNGIGVFYREAGPNDAPTILLLHGFFERPQLFLQARQIHVDQFLLILQTSGPVVSDRNSETNPWK